MILNGSTEENIATIQTERALPYRIGGDDFTPSVSPGSVVWHWGFPKWEMLSWKSGATLCHHSHTRAGFLEGVNEILPVDRRDVSMKRKNGKDVGTSSFRMWICPIGHVSLGPACVVLASVSMKILHIEPCDSSWEIRTRMIRKYKMYARTKRSHGKK